VLANESLKALHNKPLAMVTERHAASLYKILYVTQN